MVETGEMTVETPTLDPSLPRRYSDFDTLIDAIEYAAKGKRGPNFFNAKGDLIESLTWTEVYERARRLLAASLSVWASKKATVLL